MNAHRPRQLLDWHAVVVDVDRLLCRRHGRHQLTERCGAARPPLELIAADCTLMKPGEKPRQHEARCGIRYVASAAEPMPLDTPARAGEPEHARGRRRAHMRADMQSR